MSNYFAILGLPETLDLDPSEIEEAWRDRTRESRPDLSPSAESGLGVSGLGVSGPGVSTDPSDLHRARAVLGNPASRLEHWLELRGADSPTGNTIAPELMDLFSDIQGALDAADSVIDRHRQAKSDLGRAMLAKEAVAAQLRVQDRLQRIGALRDSLAARFPEFEEEAGSETFRGAMEALHQLKFLSKWEEQCRQRLLSLIEC